jgi:hypothetical protein
VIRAAGGDGTGAQLRAYNPIPVNGTMQLIKSWSIRAGTQAGDSGSGTCH